MIEFTDKFARIDTLLRSGYHITTRDLEEFNYISHISDELKEFYSLYGVELVKTSESVYYLRTQDRSLMNRRTLDEFEMTIGRLLCYMQMNLHAYTDILDGWISFESIVDEMNNLIPSEKLARIYKRKDGLTDQELISLVKKIRSKLQFFKSINMVQLKGGENLFVRPTDSIFRFASDKRGQDENDEIYAMLSSEGEYASLGEGVDDYTIDEKEDREKREEQLDMLGGDEYE